MKRLLAATALAAIGIAIGVSVQASADNYCPIGCQIHPIYDNPQVITQNTRPPWVVAVPSGFKPANTSHAVVTTAAPSSSHQRG